MGQLPLLSIKLKTAFLYCFSEGLHKVRFSRRGIQYYAAQAIASVRLGQIPPFGVLSVATDVVHVNEVRIAKATRASSPDCCCGAAANSHACCIGRHFFDARRPAPNCPALILAAFPQVLPEPDHDVVFSGEA